MGYTHDKMFVTVFCKLWSVYRHNVLCSMIYECRYKNLLKVHSIKASCSLNYIFALCFIQNIFKNEQYCSNTSRILNKLTYISTNKQTKNETLKS